LAQFTVIQWLEQCGPEPYGGARLTSDEPRAEIVARLIARGATKLWDGRKGPHAWVTMADPEGSEICVA